MRDKILSLVVFPILTALAFHFIFGHLLESRLSIKLANSCPPSLPSQTHPTTQYRIPYTGLDALDSALCPLVSFFHAALGYPDALAFLTYFVGLGAPLVIIPAVEGWRNGRSPFIAYPVIFGILYQTLTVGATMPLYWLLFVLTGSTNPKPDSPQRTMVSQAHAEAIIFGVIIGVVIPSIAMLVLEDPYVTAIWQAFPLYVSLAQYAHLAFRPASKYSGSGYSTIRALYIGTFIICSSVHFATIWPMTNDLSTFGNIFLPSIVAPDPSTTLGHGVHHFLKWDFTFAFVTSILATLWFAQNITQLLALAIWGSLGTLLFGPGAVIMGAALWRESNLQSYLTGLSVKKA